MCFGSHLHKMFVRDISITFTKLYLLLLKKMVMHRDTDFFTFFKVIVILFLSFFFVFFLSMYFVDHNYNYNNILLV